MDAPRNGRPGPWIVVLLIVLGVLVGGFGWWWNVLGPGRVQWVQEGRVKHGEHGEHGGGEGEERKYGGEEKGSVGFPVVPENSRGIVGVGVCAECHTERAEEFVATDHFRTSRVLERSEFEGRIEAGRNRLKTVDPGLVFEILAEGDGVVQRALRVESTAVQEEAIREERVALVYGAGNFDEDYFYWQSDRLFQLPVAYLHSRETWCYAPGFVDGSADFNRPVPARCLECHVTSAEPLPGAANRYDKRSLVLGVTCERCHGAGEAHVAHHRGAAADSDPAFIVMPSDLSRQAQLDLCGQCHGNAEKRRTAPFSFQPGDRLEDHFRMDLNEFPEEDHTANQLRYLQASACFQQTATMTCTTCHDPHADRATQRAGSIASCTNCHQSDDCGERPRLSDSIRDACVDCHMPKRPVANITFDVGGDRYVPAIERHDHRIAVHPDATLDVKLSELSARGEASSPTWNELLSERQAMLIAEAEATEGAGRWLAAALALRRLVELEPSGPWQTRLDEILDRRRRTDRQTWEALRAMDQKDYPTAIAKLRGVLEERPGFAVAEGRLGLLLAETGELEEGMQHLQRVAELDPDDGYGLALLGYIELTRGNPSAAKAHYDQAAEIDPYNAKLEFYRGVVRMQLGEFDEALRLLDRSIEIDSSTLEAPLARVAVLSKQGDHEAAITAGRQLAEQTFRRNPTVLVGLADAYAAAGRKGEAASALSQALPLVPPEQRKELEERIAVLKAD